MKVSATRISEYKALASPSLISLSSPDPLLTAFQLSWELKELANAEPESKTEYRKLRKQVEKLVLNFLLSVLLVSKYIKKNDEEMKSHYINLFLPEVELFEYTNV